MLGGHSTLNTVVLAIGEGISKYEIHPLCYFGHHSSDGSTVAAVRAARGGRAACVIRAHESAIIQLIRRRALFGAFSS
jgi:hypothetical protein